jgi:hypothetical protein
MDESRFMHRDDRPSNGSAMLSTSERVGMALSEAARLTRERKPPRFGLLSTLVVRFSVGVPEGSSATDTPAPISPFTE